MTGEYEVKEPILIKYHTMANKLLSWFEKEEFDSYLEQKTPNLMPCPS